MFSLSVLCYFTIPLRHQQFFFIQNYVYIISINISNELRKHSHQFMQRHNQYANVYHSQKSYPKGKFFFKFKKRKRKSKFRFPSCFFLIHLFLLLLAIYFCYRSLQFTLPRPRQCSWPSDFI